MAIRSGLFKQELFKTDSDGDKIRTSWWTSTETVDIDEEMDNKETALVDATSWDTTYDTASTQPTGLTNFISKVTTFFKNVKFLKNRVDTMNTSLQQGIDSANTNANGRVSKTGDTMSGDLLFADSSTTTRQIRGVVGTNDYWRVAGGATAANGGWMEIATADDGNEPIYARQYTGAYSNPARTAIILGSNGQTEFPVSVKAPSFIEGNTTLSGKYLSITTASSTYLSKADANTSYLKKSDASNTYLTKTNASNTYFPKTGGTISGNVILNRNIEVNGDIALAGEIFGDVRSTNIRCKRVQTYEICNPNGQDNGYVNFTLWDNSGHAPIRASAFTQISSKHTKTNVTDISEEDALKLLQIRPINFDYKAEFGGQTDNIGVLAEDTYEVLPKVVVMPEEYTEEGFDESKGIHQSLPSVDYGKFVPYLIKLAQIQQKEIEELKTNK